MKNVLNEYYLVYNKIGCLLLLENIFVFEFMQNKGKIRITITF